MKRSDAIKGLKKHLSDNLHTDLTYSFLENILDYLEYNAGMLPPSRMRYTDQDNGNTLVSEECSWEKEPIQVKWDHTTGEAYIELTQFKHLVDISKIDSYEFEVITDVNDMTTGTFIKFYDINGIPIEVKE